jgi:uncharacterized membrane protein YfcA
MQITTFCLLAVASFFAGFVDAVSGGGGLIQLPALLIGMNSKPIPMILGTNKVPSIFGTTSAAINYVRNIKPDLHTTLYMAIPAFLGSLGGARLAAEVPTQVFRPLIIALLILVALYTIFRPHFGMEENLKFSPKKTKVIVSISGLVIGFYDGIFGPGTGTFLVFILVGLIGYAFIKASATAKIVNIATNFAAIVSFQFTGHIWWKVGLGLAVANIAGGIAGSHLAIKGGSKLVRKFFLVVSVLLIIKVGYDWLHN